MQFILTLLKRLYRLWGCALFWLRKLLKAGSFFVALIIIPLGIVWYSIGKIVDIYEFSDDAESRGAVAISNDPFDKPTSEPVYLSQGWKPEDSLWFYRASQGSNLLPYDFFLELQRHDAEEFFRSADNINRYRYLPQEPTSRNPDGLPVGMSLDTYKGKRYLGFTCAACHTSQINYKGKAIRIDGGPAAANMENFLIDMASALESTRDAKDNNPEKYQRFTEAVLDRNEYDSKEEIDADLEKYARIIRTYTEVNHPSWEEKGENGVTHYGFARLDAFGRIYNRVLQHVMSAEELNKLIQELAPDTWAKAKPELEALAEDEDQTHIVDKTLVVLEKHFEGKPAVREATLKRLREVIYNPANAPVSYPYLWDIPHHDYVQWTGLVSNEGLRPLGRNVGQVIGVFGTLDWQKKEGWSFNTLLGGQGFGETHVDFRSSINKRNLRRVENHLRRLTSPQWPKDILGSLDEKRIARGKELFNEYCVSCHKNIDREDEDRRIIVHMSHIDSVGTDPITAENSINYSGNSGILKNTYVSAGIGNVLLEQESKLAPLVKFSTKNVVVDWDPDKNFLRRIAEWLYDIMTSVFSNPIKPSLKQGDYDIATTRNPYAPLKAYKARALNGIWATAPYLHNGSVPNLYELLLPKKRDGDPDWDSQGNTIQYRSDTFQVGSREFDETHVGFRTEGYNGFTFDTSIRGNSNAGHEYAAGITPLPDGTRLPPLDGEQRLDLLEYLKQL